MSADATAVLQRTADLEAEGRWAEAIDVLVAAVDDTHEPRLEVALADIRHRSWRHLTMPDPLPPLPAPEGGPAVGPSGLPEATLAELTGASLRAGLAAHGSVLVRGAVDPAGVELLRNSIDSSFDGYDTPPEERDDPGWFSPLKLDDTTVENLGARRLGIPRAFARETGGVLLSDTPRTMSYLLSMYEDLGLYDITKECLGDRPVMSALKCTLRRVGLDAVGGWHQDGAFLGQGIRALNMWLTLSPCGVDAPGLDIVPIGFDHIVETGSHGAAFDWAVGDDKVAEVAADTGVLRPQFEAGDLVIFDQMMLHRTAVEPSMTLERHAIEFWCFAASAYPDTHVPLVW